MEDNKLTVLITTSGIGNRLGNLTKFTNKSLVRIGKKPALSYIIDSYPDNTEFIITTGYYGDHVKQFIGLIYSDKNIKCIDVERFEGNGSSLLNSMVCAKNFLQKPFIFHACDSIAFNVQKSTNLNQNWCLSSTSDSPEHYRTHNTLNDKIQKIEEKGESLNPVHVGVVGINDYKNFWLNAETLIKNFPNDQALSDCHVINKMIDSGVEFKQIFCDWFDIGNLKSLDVARKNINDRFDILDKDDESIFIFEDRFVVKFFHNQFCVKNRIDRIKHLGKFAPKLLGSSKNFYIYEYIRGIEASKTLNKKDLNRLVNELFKKFWIRMPRNSNTNELARSFYIDKTIDRANMFFKKVGEKDKSVEINGERIESLKKLLQKIPDNIFNTYLYRFHGDLVLDNIILGKTVKLIDWRQDFCGNIESGDIYYDLAKFNHSLTINHDIVAKKLYVIHKTDINDKKHINVDILNKSFHSRFKEEFRDMVIKNGFDYQKVELLSAIIWINMSPLHDIEFGKFLYYFGLYNLNNAINKIRGV